MVRDSWVFNSLLIALSYVPAVGCTVAYYWLWFAGSKESVARLIWLLVLMLLLMVSFKLLYLLQRTCFFNAKVRLERRQIRKRLHGILQTDNFDLTADDERFVRAYASIETEQSPNHIAGIALLLSVVTFTFGEFNVLPHLKVSQNCT